MSVTIEFINQTPAPFIIDKLTNLPGTTITGLEQAQEISKGQGVRVTLSPSQEPFRTPGLGFSALLSIVVELSFYYKSKKEFDVQVKDNQNYAAELRHLLGSTFVLTMTEIN